MNTYEIAAKRIASGARTEKELVDFLCKKGIDREEAKMVAGEFKSDGYIDDLRYSGDYIRYGEGKGWGKSRIVRELTKKGVDSETIREAYSNLCTEAEEREGEEERALSVINKMMRGADPKMDEKTRSRIARRLFSYGYNTSVIYSAIRRFEESIKEDSGQAL